MSGAHRVVVLLLAPVVGFDAAIPPQLFGGARAANGERLYEVTTAGITADPVPTEHGYQFVPGADASALDQADTVVVPGTRLPSARRHGVLDRDVRDAFDRIRPGTRLVSICTGAFALAAAGRLDGRPATTHWAHADAFRRLFPAVRLDEDRLFVDDGDVLTSAGLAAGIDLCLHIIRRDHGVAVANRVARQCVVPPWRAGGQAQFIERPVPALGDDSTASARDWALHHLAQPIDVARLAGLARMSVRTFNRRFREETGQSPGAWLLAQRMAHAQHLLEVTDAPVDEVARLAGLGSGATLRQHLRAAVGVSPVAYRRTFRGADVLAQTTETA
ncbi:MAG TPA: helix-turn-helix domain-containing protein [Jatrophihabitans sp.]|nr:helix-turn-helix domain-containing protein [Jatrophihabitans sp.]